MINNNTKKILSEDAVAHTIHFINMTVRDATHQALAKDCKSDFFVMSGNLVEQVIDSIEYRNAKSALVIGDAGLQIINRLIQEGIDNITLALSRFENKEIEIPGVGTCYLLDNVSYIIKSTFPNIKINIIDFKETAGMKTDLVIANFPYGAIGANLTKNVIDNVDFKEFVNLLPAKDYKRNVTKDLFNYQSDMIAINNGFEDADVTTHIAHIHKTKVNTMDLAEFERSNYTDPQLNSYFEQNYKRSGSAFDRYDCGHGNSVLSWSPTKTFILQSRNISDHYMGGKSSAPYIWNKLHGFTIEDFVAKYNSGRARRGNYIEVQFYGVTFDTEQEHLNFCNFIYSNTGHQFISKIFTALNCDGGIALTNIFPKVDWTKPWTVEEILADYGYTINEIKEVMADLVNFKGIID